jgi:hypothetical protein
MWHEILCRLNNLSPFLNNVVAGIATASVLFLLSLLYKHFRQYLTFSPMEGDYDLCDFTDKAGELAAKSPLGTVKSEVRSSTLHTRGISLENRVEWTGQIQMNLNNPNVGDGVYFDFEKTDCGTHHVQRNPETGDFVVMGSNTSHPHGVTRYNLIWKPKVRR